MPKIVKLSTKQLRALIENAIQEDTNFEIGQTYEFYFDNQKMMDGSFVSPFRQSGFADFAECKVLNVSFEPQTRATILHLECFDRSQDGFYILL